MKLFYGNTPVNSMKVKHYEMDTNSATVQPSDLQAGITCFAKGKKITGTGKAFEFASYGGIETNREIFSPSVINVIEISSIEYPVKLSTALNNMYGLDFTKGQIIGYVVIDGTEYPVTASVNGVILTLTCEKTITLEAFYGKDNYR